MNSRLYTRLAVTNMKNNKQFYIPYLITGIITIAMFYIIVALQGNEGFNDMPGGADLKMILGLGIGVIGICAVIFLFYTNSFIIKRRKKELGVYNILGMEKQHLAKVLFRETLFTAVIAIVIGLVTGILFNKLMCMLLYRLMGFDAGIDFYVSIPGIRMSLILFLGIYLLTFIYDLLQVRLANPIELLHGGNVGEREPKTKIILTVLGVVCLGVGYYIAITTKSPLEALMLFFLAVILVILGTYFLFVAGSIALLKILRKNKKYYYNARHFTAVSGMLYRMKQNAVGLANICILSTMVLVTLSTTISLYIGIGDEMKARYPYDITVNAQYGDGEITGEEEIADKVQQALDETGRRIINNQTYANLNFVAAKSEDGYVLDHNYDSGDYAGLTMFNVITREGCASIFDEEVAELADHEVMILTNDADELDQLTIAGETFQVKDNLTYTQPNEDYLSDMVGGGTYYVVVNDKEQMAAFYNLQRAAYGDNASSYNYIVSFDLDGTKEDKIAFDTLLSQKMTQMSSIQTANGDSLYCESRQANEDDIHKMYGGFLFLGIYLGTMFLMITVLIIFYKQISEGYDDKERFAIMEKVGMSNAEVKATISGQIRIVFFLPLVAAGIHVVAAFPMINRLLILMNLYNTTLFRWCVLGTIVVFGAIYLLVFLITSRTYYKIVGRQV